MLSASRRPRGPRTVRLRADRPWVRHGFHFRLRDRFRLRPSLQALEERQLLSVASARFDVVQPTAVEQYLLELVNRARANPSAEGARLVQLAKTDPTLLSATRGWDLDRFRQVIDAYAAMPPLAFNTRLIEAARGASARMLATNSQAHSPRGYLTDPQVARAADGQAFYSIAGASSWSTGENIYAYSKPVQSSEPAAYADFFAASFLIDWGNPRFGHLKNTLAPGPGGGSGGTAHAPFSEIGIGMLLEVAPTVPPGLGNAMAQRLGVDVGPAIVTESFGYRSGNAFLTGSFYLDQDGGRFYTPGEGLGGVVVRAVGTAGQGSFQAETWASGGYTLPLPPGTYVVSATGAGLPRPLSTRVTIGVDNVSWGSGVPVQAQAQAADLPVPGDFAGAAGSELAVYRSAEGLWLIDGRATPLRFGGWGIDTPLPGDYDGDGRVEPAVYRPATGDWFVFGSNGGRLVGTLGAPGDIPVPGDYDGDGRVEPAVYRPATAQWFALGPGGVRLLATFGGPGIDVPVPGDYDGLGRAEPAVYRPSTAQWFVFGPKGGRLLATFGQPGVDIPVPGRYDGPDRVEPAVYRPTTAEWFILGPRGARTFAFGAPNLDVPVRADLDGDGATDPTVYRPTTAEWFARLSTGGTLQRFLGQGGVSSSLSTWLSPSSPRPSPRAAQARIAPLAEAEPAGLGAPVTTRPPALRRDRGRTTTITPRNPTPPLPPPPPRRAAPRWWEPLADTRRRQSAGPLGGSRRHPG